MSTEPPPPRRSGNPTPRPIAFDDTPLRQLTAGTRRCVRTGGLGRIILWLGLAVSSAIAIDLASSLAAPSRAFAGGLILIGVAVLAMLYFWLLPRKTTLATATCDLESAHPEFGQMLRTARDASHSSDAIAPALKEELFRRTAVHLAALDLEKSLPTRAAKRWLLAGITALAGFIVFLNLNHEAPTALARLVAPFSGVTYTRVANVTPDPTFDRNRLPRVEAVVTGRSASNVTVHVSALEGGDQAYPMNPLGGGRYEVTLPASESSFAFRIEAGDSKPAIGIMECIDPAEFVSSSAEIAQPDYTGQPLVRQDTADIKAVEGTTATLHFRMSAPMAKAALKLPGGTVVPLEVRGNELTTILTVQVGGDVAELTGTDARGHGIEPTQFNHKGFADTLPVVDWIEPTKDIEATAVAEIPLRLRIRDDFGIASYGVVLQAHGDSKEILTRSVEARDLRDLSELAAAALESFPLTIRDNVRVYAWATDHKPRENARAVSQFRSVDIKPFKRRWQMIKAPSGPMIPMEDIEQLDGLVKTQRGILSDAFAVIQGNATPPSEPIKGFGEREAQLRQQASAIHKEVEEEGNWPADDINLLAAAVSQMGESSEAWFAIKAQAGFDRGDAALSTLLELRKNLLTLLMKSEQPSLEAKPEEVPNELTDLAKEADRLAREERDVAQQLVATPDADRLAAIRRQQDIAKSDTGELYSRMIDHPEATPMILSHMADAEKSVRDATRTTRSEDAITDAPPQLSSAADALESVAKHLRALDEANMDETLAEMATEAKKAAESSKPKDEGEQPTEDEKEEAAKEPGEKPGDKPKDNPGNRAGEGEKPGEIAGDKPGSGEGKSKSEQAGKGEGEGQGQGKGSGQGESKDSQVSQGSPGKKGQGFGNVPGDGDGEVASNDPDAGNTSGSGETPGTTSGGGPAAKPGDSQTNDPATERKEALAKAARQAATNDDILRFFAERESKDGKDSRFDALRKGTDSAAMEQKLNDVANGKTDGAQTAEDLKALAAALEQERELRRQSKLESLAKSREKAAELKKQAEAKRDAAKKAAQEIAKVNNGGFSFDLPKSLEDLKKAQGKGEGDSPGEGGKSGQAVGKGPGRPTMGAAAKELAKEIDALKDPELSRIAEELEKAGPEFADVKPLAAAERRLAAMIAEISGLARSDSSDGNIPPAYRRAVEDYYRALSDDFGDEKPESH